MSYAQFGETQAKGALSLSTAGSDVTNIGLNSLFANQAGLADTEAFGVMVTAVQLYGLEQVSDVSLAIALPTQSIGTFAIGVSNYNFAAFSEQMVGLAYGKSIGKKTSLGAKFNLINIGIDNFGNSLNASVELGVQTQLMEKVRFGAHVLSPIGTIVTNDQRLPTRLSIGVAYLPSKKLAVSLEGAKYIDGLFTGSLGINYKIIELLSLRMGAATNPGLFTAGIALHLKQRYSIELGLSIHEILGTTPGITLAYQGLGKTDN